MSRACWSRRLKNLVIEARINHGRNSTPSFLIVDSQTVRNTETGCWKGYDAGKKVSGIKRHIAVDTLGLPHALAISSAGVSDRLGAVYAIAQKRRDLQGIEAVMCDGGYTGGDFAAAIKHLIGADVQIAKRSEMHKFKVIPKRWIVERSFAWIDKCRRLWRNCERLPNTSKQFVFLAFLSITLRRI